MAFEPRARKERRLGGAMLLVSLALHGLVALWAVSRPRPVPPPPPHQAIELEMVVVAPKAPAPKEVAPAAVVPPAAAPKTKAKAAEAPPAPPAPVAAAAPSTANMPLTDSPSATFVVPAPSPNGPSAKLLPRVGLVAPDALAQGRGVGTGVTTRNSPDELPDPVAMKDYRNEQTGRALQKMAEGMAAASRVGISPPHPYFGQLGSSFREGLSKGNVAHRQLTTGEAIADSVESWRKPAEQFARNSNPGISADEAKRHQQRSLARAAERVNATGDVNNGRWLEGGAQMMGSIQAIFEASSRERLRVVVELVQDQTGALAVVNIMESSGDTQFDDYVVHRVRRVVRDRGEVEAGVPGFGRGWRSVWRFTYEPPKVGATLLQVQALKEPL